MAPDTNALSLPSVVGDETIISLQKAVVATKKSTGFFSRRDVAKGDLLYKVGDVPDAIYMLHSGTVRLKASASGRVRALPATTMYHATPGNGANRPLLGARYFFMRQPCSLEYFAETPCLLYKITSASLKDLHDTDRNGIIMMMYWLVASSDMSDLCIPKIIETLGLDPVSVAETQGLLRGVEEFRAAREDPRMPELLYNLFKGLVSRRIARAGELGIEPSIVQPTPRTDRIL